MTAAQNTKRGRRAWCMGFSPRAVTGSGALAGRHLPSIRADIQHASRSTVPPEGRPGAASVPARVDVGGRAEAGPDRACEKLSSGGFDAALDRAVVDRRLAPLGVREANLGLSPRQRLALTLVLLAGIRLHDRDHAAIRLSDNLRVTTHRLGKILRNPAGFEHSLRMAQSDPLDRAVADLKAVVLKQLHPRQSERLIGGKVDDGALQRP